MTTDRDTEFLGSELHELVDGIAPDRGAGMQRAQRAIARRARNRRAAMGAAGAAVALVAAIVFVAVDRDTESSQRPAGTTTPSVSTPATPAPTTTLTTGPGSPIESTIPKLSELPAATASYSETFPWGTADYEVAFHTPQGEGASGGPLAFTAQADANITMLDHSSSRIVRFYHGVSPATHIALASPAVTAAVFDGSGRVFVATVTDLAVFGPQGEPEGSWNGISNDMITGLEVVDNHLYATNGDTRTLLLRPDGLGYAPVDHAAPQPSPITVSGANDTQAHLLTVSAAGTEYRISTGLTDLLTVKLLPDGSLVFVVGPVQSDSGHQDEAMTYVLGRIDRAGHAKYTTFEAATGYLIHGPEFVVNGDGLAVLGSTTTGGVTISYYPFD